MLGDVMKMAMALLVVALLSAGALKDRFFARAPSAAAPAPIQTASPARPPAAAPARPKWGQVELAPDARSQYRAPVEINGARIEALVDTGASHVLLKAEDARLLNIDPPASAYTGRSQTANGVARFAPVRLRNVRIGDIVVYDVEAAVAEPGATPLTLLGMSFLKKLSNFQVADGLFVMKQ